MAGVHVAHLKAGALARKAAGAERRERAQVLELGQRVFLLHELRELVGGKKFFDAGLQRARVNKLLRQGRVGVDGRHAVLDIALHVGQAHAQPAGEHLADVAHAPGAEVVDVVLLGLRVVLQFEHVVDDEHQVIQRKRLAQEVRLLQRLAEALVKTVAAHAREVVALGAEDGVDVILGVLCGRQVAVAQALVDFDIGLLHGFGGVLLYSGLHPLFALGSLAEERLEVGVKRGTQYAQERYGRELALAVDAHRDVAQRVGLHLYPRAARGDYFGAEVALALDLVGGKEDAVRARELRHDDALDAVDDKGAVAGHDRQVGEEYLLLLFAAGYFVLQADLGADGDVERRFLRFGVVLVVLGFAELNLQKLEVKLFARVVLDGRKFFKCLTDTLLEYPLIGVHLRGDKVGGRSERGAEPGKYLFFTHSDVEVKVNKAPGSPNFSDS